MGTSKKNRKLTDAISRMADLAGKTEEPEPESVPASFTENGDAEATPKMAVKPGKKKAGAKARPEPLTHLNTRQPVSLVKEIKIYCVTNDISVQDFVTEAIKMRLKK